MLARQRRRHHALTDRLEDFRFPQIGYEEPERQAFRQVARFDVGSGSGPTLHQSRELKVSDGSSDGDSRRAELPLELGFARQAVAGFHPARLDFALERIEHLLVLRLLARATHSLMI